MDIFVVNEASALAKAVALPGVSDDDVAAWRLSWALDYQAVYQFARSGWPINVRVIYLPGGAKATIPRGGAVLHLADSAGQSGALGYHDEDGNEVPYAEVGVQDALSDGDTPSEVASHEALELAADPHVNLSALNGDATKLFAYEMCDAVQGNAYDLGEPQGRQTGIQVADFVLACYFDPNTPASQPTSYRHAVQGPFSLAPQGYASYIDLTNPQAGWQQMFGQQRSELPKWASRLPRRHKR